MAERIRRPAGGAPAAAAVGSADGARVAIAHAKVSTKKAEDAADTDAHMCVEWEAGNGTGNGDSHGHGGAGPRACAYAAVFDGHGGRQAAHHCRDMMRAEMGTALAAALPAHGGSAAAAIPAAARAAFAAAHAAFEAKGEPSGTTATVALVVDGGVRRTRPERGASAAAWGHEPLRGGGLTLSVSNVGDSHCYLDTGTSVALCSADHRLDTSARERERVKACPGGSVGRSALEEGGKGVGPLRAWPGGLAMARTLGDCAAHPIISAEPETRQVYVPRGCAARLIIASDGLWDGLSAKAAAKLVRAKPATTAAPALCQAAKKARGLRDDITVVVIDVLPGGAGDTGAHSSPFAGRRGRPWEPMVVDADRPSAAVSKALGGEPPEEAAADAGASGAGANGAEVDVAPADGRGADGGAATVGVTPASADERASDLRELAAAQGLPVDVVLASAGVCGAETDAGGEGWTDVPVKKSRRAVASAAALADDADSGADGWIEVKSEQLPRQGDAQEGKGQRQRQHTSNGRGDAGVEAEGARAAAGNAEGADGEHASIPNGDVAAPDAKPRRHTGKGKNGNAGRGKGTATGTHASARKGGAVGGVHGGELANKSARVSGQPREQQQRRQAQGGKGPGRQHGTERKDCKDGPKQPRGDAAPPPAPPTNGIMVGSVPCAPVSARKPAQAVGGAAAVARPVWQCTDA
eukprot:PRCOL_00005245-RA